MKDLFTAIYTKFATTPYSSFYNAVTGLFIETAPQNIDYPYATYHLVSNSHDYSWTSTFEEAAIDFNLISDSTAGVLEITQLYEKLKEVYDDCALSVTGYNHLRMRRENAWLNSFPTTKPDRTLYQYTVQYNILNHKEDT